MRRKSVELLVMLAVAALAIWEGVRVVTSYEDKPGSLESGGFIALLGFLLGLLAVYHWFQPDPRRGGHLFDWRGNKGTRQVVIVVALFGGYIFLVGYLGYLLATALFFPVYLRLFGSYRWASVLLGSAALAGGSTLLWVQLGLVLPRGILGWP